MSRKTIEEESTVKVVQSTQSYWRDATFRMDNALRYDCSECGYQEIHEASEES